MLRLEQWLLGYHSLVTRFSMAVILALLAILLNEWTWSAARLAPFGYPLAAALLSALFGGIGPGIFALIIANTGVLAFQLPELYALALLNSSYNFQFVLFNTLAVVAVFAGGWAREFQRSARLSRERLRDLLEDLGGAALIWKVDARTLQFRELILIHGTEVESREILGYSIQHWLNEPLFWERHVELEDREQVLRGLRQAAIYPRSTHRFEHRFVGSEGESVWFRTSVHVSGPDEISGVSIEVDSQKKAEEELLNQQEWRRVMGELADFGICCVSSSGQLIYLNREAEKFFGQTSEELVGREIEEFIRSPVQEVIQRGAAYETEEGVFLRRDGTSLPIQCWVRPVRGEAGQALGAVLGFRAQAEPRLAQAALSAAG